MGLLSLPRRKWRSYREKRNALRKRDKGKGKENQSDIENRRRSKQSPLIEHEGWTAPKDGSQRRRIIRRVEMQSTRECQDASIFFSKLPLEIRRLIYRQIFANYLRPRGFLTSSIGSDLRLHIYRGDTAHWKLGHTPCELHIGEPEMEDVFATSPLSERMFSQGLNPPSWFFVAWVFRMIWGRHWKCQDALQKRWDPQTGQCREVEKAPFLPLFLTCKSMYDEAVTLFFEEVTPIFTSSEDAHHFFIQKPHPYLSSLRTVEFSFCNPNDHLYLCKVWRESLQKLAAKQQADNIAGHDEGIPPPPAIICPTIRKSNEFEDYTDSPFFWEKINVFGKQLWVELLGGVRKTSPTLKNLDVTIGGKITQRAVLAPFGGPEAQGFHTGQEGAEEEAGNAINNEGGQASTGQSDVHQAPDDIWELRGTLDVLFSQTHERFVQRGSKMIRLVPGGQQAPLVNEEV